MKNIIPVIVLSLLLSACNNNSKPEYIKSIQIRTPGQSTLWKSESNIPITIVKRKKNINIDSVEIFLNKNKINTLYEKIFSTSIHIPKDKIGAMQIKAIAHHSKSKKGICHMNIEVLPNKEPVKYTYELVNTFTHDTSHFTQGIFLHNNILYESTGRRGKSYIYKLNYQKNKVLLSKKLPNKLFGEGITKYKNKIFQLSWQNKKGIVYDIKTFNKLSEFSYKIEGWGITTVKDQLVMSDGTNKLYFLDPNDFNISKTINVYSNYGKVTYINELEYINNHIYANILGNNIIVKINPNTGIVEGIIDLNPLCDKLKIEDRENVLNGIAYNKKNNSLLVTGKRWPHIFEIKVIEYR